MVLADRLWSLCIFVPDFEATKEKLNSPLFHNGSFKEQVQRKVFNVCPENPIPLN